VAGTNAASFVPFMQRAAPETTGVITDERLYGIVAPELQAGVLRQGLWPKALHLSEGDEAAARHRYIGLRVYALKQENRKNATTSAEGALASWQWRNRIESWRRAA
jgi:hypothetical protein